MTADAARRRLRLVGARIERTSDLLDGLYAERLALFQALVAEGDTQRQIADLVNADVRAEGARISAMAVANQLHKARHRVDNGAE